MSYIIIAFFILSIILSIVVFKVKGLFILIITIPLLIIYLKIDTTKKITKHNLLERKEVKVVSSRNSKKEKRKKLNNLKEKLKSLKIKKSDKEK